MLYTTPSETQKEIVLCSRHEICTQVRDESRLVVVAPISHLVPIGAKPHYRERIPALQDESTGLEDTLSSSVVVMEGDIAT
jgi:hypothetical protein